MIYYKNNDSWIEPSAITTTYNGNNNTLIIKPKDYLDYWSKTFDNAFPENINVASAAYSEQQNKFVVIFASGASNTCYIYTSLDGINWSLVYHKANDFSDNVVYNPTQNKWLRISINTNNRTVDVLQSTDCITWSSSLTTSLADSTELDFDHLIRFQRLYKHPTNDNYYYVSSKYGLLMSSDGGKTFYYRAVAEWNSTNNITIYGQFPPTKALGEIIGDNNFVLIFMGRNDIDSNNLFHCYIYAYSNGTEQAPVGAYLLAEFEKIDGVGMYLRSMAYSPELGIYVAMNEYNGQADFIPSAIYSFDLINWHLSKLPSDAGSDVRWIPEMHAFIAIGASVVATNSYIGACAYSYDGINWHNIETQFSNRSFDRCVYAKGIGRAIAVSRSNTNANIVNIMTSKCAGIISSNTAFHSGNYSITTNNYSLYNNNDIQWTENNNPEFYLTHWDSSHRYPIVDGLDIEIDGSKQWFSNTKLNEDFSLMCTSGGYRLTRNGDVNPLIMYSSNGIDWSYADIPSTAFGFATDMIWSQTYQEFMCIGSVTDNNEPNGYILHGDGKNFDIINIPYPGYWCGIAEHNGILLVSQLYNNGYPLMLRSTDKGQNWEIINFATIFVYDDATNYGFRRVLWSEGCQKFIAIYCRGMHGIATSIDGVNWEQHPITWSLSANTFNGYAYADCLYFDTSPVVTIGSLHGHTASYYNDQGLVRAAVEDTLSQLNFNYQIRQELYIQEYRCFFYSIQKPGIEDAVASDKYMTLWQNYPHENVSQRRHIQTFDTPRYCENYVWHPIQGRLIGLESISSDFESIEPKIHLSYSMY